MSYETVFTISGRSIKFQKFFDRHIDEPLPPPTIHERDKNYGNVYGEERSIRQIDTSRSMREYCHKPEDFS